MRLPSFVAVLLVATGLSACTRVDVGPHLTASDYDATIRRMFVVNGLDPTFNEAYVGSFATSLVTNLNQCGVSALVYRPDSMELDAEAKLRSALASFKPDTALLVHETIRYTVGSDTQAGSYVFILRDNIQKRDIWKAAIRVGAAASFLTDRSVAGPKIAERVVQQMAADHVLKTCASLPPSAG